MFVKDTEGTVKWFNNNLGYGFIVSEAYPNDDIFVHHSNIETEGFRTLYAGQPVKFEVHFEHPRKEEDNGLQAKKVIPLAPHYKEEDLVFAYTATNKEFIKDKAKLVNGNLIVIKNDTKYIVRLDENGQFNYYEVM